MFSPDRYTTRRVSFGTVEDSGQRNYIGLKTAFRTKSTRTPLQQAAHFRFSEPVTPSIEKERGLKPSDLSDPHKRQFLTQLTNRVFHLAVTGVDGEGDKKISLERLFTPATDSGDLTPKKASSRKMYSSSAFYRPDHPTIDDQVELAQRISFSLVDDNNKMSRGQSMYLKRKNRSMRWIHQGSGAGGEMPEEEMQRPLEKPPMKLLMNPKGVQDFQAVQEHYENLMNAPTSPDVGKIVVQSPVIAASPSGKGAELFAKRKKRMDKFIVDETTVQKAQQQTTSVQQTSSFSSSFSSSSKSVSSSSSFTSMKQAEMERNRQQEQIMFAAPPMGGAPTAPAAAPASGPFNLPELTKILTQPPKSEFSKSKTESSELNPVASKTSLVARKARIWQPSGNTLTSQQPRRAEAHAHLPPYPLARNPILVPAPPAVSTCLLQTSAQSFLSSCPCPSSTLPCLSAKNPNINDNTSNAAAICPKTVCSPRIQPGSLTSLQLFKISECLKSSSASSVPPEKSSLPESVVSPGGSRDNNVTAGDKQLSNSFSSTPISASNVISAPLTVTTSPLPSATKNAFDCNTVLQSFHPQSTLPVSECASLSTCMPPSLAVTTAFSLSAAPRENICSGKSALPASTVALSLSVTSTIVTPASFSVASISDVQHFTSAVATSIAIAVSSGNALQASSAQNCTFTTPLSVKAQPSDSLSSYSLAPSKLKPGMKCDPTSVLPNPDEQNQYHSTKLTPPPLSHSNINFDSPEDSSLIQVDQEASLSNIEDLDPKIIYINTQACSNITNQGNQIIQSNQINCADENTCELKASNHTSDNRPLRPTSLPLIPMSQLVNSVVPHSHGTPAQSLLSTPPSALHSLLPDVNGAGQNTVTSSGSTACCTVDSTSFCLEQSPHCKNTFTQTLHTPIMSVVKTVPNVAPPEGSQVTLAGQSVKLPSALVLPKGSICPPASMIVSPDSRRSPSPTGRQKDDTADGNFDELGTPYCFVKCKTQATPYICKQQTQIEASHAPDCETFIGMSKVESQMSFGSESEQSDYSVSLMDDEELENIEVAVPEIRIAHIHRPSINETELRKYLGELEDMFKQNPDEVSSITVDDLKPPDFYRSVSRTSLNQEVEDGESLLIDDDSHGSKSNLTVTPFAQLKVDMSHDQRLHSEEQSREEASPLPSSKCAATNLSNASKRDGDESGERERQSAPAVAGREGRESGGQREKKDTEQICSSVDEERSTMEACKDISQPFESPWLRSASPPVFPSSKDTNPPTPSAGTGAIYTAEVKVVQRASLPPTPVDIPQHSLLDLVEQDSNVNKRRSLNFNLAAKGFGTYNNFYTPVTFAT